METTSGQVIDINYDELIDLQKIGEGSFGVVYKGTWNNQLVAIKVTDSSSKSNGFITELKQLSRVRHPNIVKLFAVGHRAKVPVCLVMEYADYGSLYDVLHRSRQISYTSGHGINWALQTARGVAYLHEMKPKPLVHRDLKSPNLLLSQGGRVIKICDFGTACDKHTIMTNNKGSAAWMAPEVFEGSSYTEKCDIFSWSIILWEILTRCLPFNTGNNQYQIMWSVHKGKRPSMIQNCPKPLESLMTSCWDQVPDKRPSMTEVVRVMSHLVEFFPGQEEPLGNVNSSQSDFCDDTSTLDSNIRSIQEKSLEVPYKSQVPAHVDVSPPSCLPIAKSSMFVQELTSAVSPSHVMNDDSVYNLYPHFPSDYSIGLTPHHYALPGYYIPEPSPSVPLETNGIPDLPPITCNNSLYPHLKNQYSWSSFGELPYFPACKHQYEQDEDQNTEMNTYFLNRHENDCSTEWCSAINEGSSNTDGRQNSRLDSILEPFPPCKNNPESVKVYNEHKQLAEEYLMIQRKLATITRTRDELIAELEMENRCSNNDSSNSQEQINEYLNLLEEKAELTKFQQSLQTQLDMIKRRNQKSPTSRRI